MIKKIAISLKKIIFENKINSRLQFTWFLIENNFLEITVDHAGTFIISQALKRLITTSSTCKTHSKQSIFNKQETMTKLSLHKPMIKAMQTHT